MSTHRFWPLATLILLPVLVLAAVAAYGLAQRRSALRAEAAQLIDARLLEEDWLAAVAEQAALTERVVLYPLQLVPGPGTERDTKLEKAIRDRDITVLAGLGYGNPAWTTASGLPGQAIARWHWMQAHDTLLQVRYWYDTVYYCSVVYPSLLSPAIIDDLAQRQPDAAVEWRKRWQDLEVRREALRLVSSQEIQRPGAGPLVILLPPRPSAWDPVEPLRWPLQAPSSGLGRPRDSIAWIHEPSAGATRVLWEGELRAACFAMQSRVAKRLPAWAAVNVKLKAIAASAWPHQDPLSVSLGEELPPGQILSTGLSAGGVIQTGVRDPALLMRDYYRLVWWVAGIIGGALFTALLGLWLVRRTLNKERRLGELKSQFVSSVSHELRAPIGSVRLMADALASGKVTGAPADEFHRLIASEGARLSALIENVLDFARIEQGRKKYLMAGTDLPALIHDAVRLMKPQADARKQAILADFQPLPFVPEIDAPAMQQALINLLDNALKFSPEGSEVRVSLTHDPARRIWSLTVADQGPGIPPAERERIFERFYRLGNELRRETTGTGIGLAIVKHVVEGHGGQVRLESGPGGGSVFILAFPAGVGVGIGPIRLIGPI